MDSKALLAAVRAAQGLPSNYALARFLDVRENTLARWHSGRHTPDDATAAKLARLAGLDVGMVLASMAAQRAATAEERTLWEGIAQRLATAAGVVAAAILAVFLAGAPDAQARASTEESGASLAAVVLLTIRRSARVLQRLAALARDALEPCSGMPQACAG